MLPDKISEITTFLGFLDIYNAENFMTHVDIYKRTFLNFLTL